MQLFFEFDEVYLDDYVPVFQDRVNFFNLHNPGVVESWSGSIEELWGLIHNYWNDHALL